jgi:S-adenosylhomocysteine hydrolase
MRFSLRQPASYLNIKFQHIIDGDFLPNTETIIQKAKTRFYGEEQPTEIPQFMPLVRELCEEFFEPDHRFFANVDALFIQHHLGPFGAKIREMCNYGLDPSRCWFVDIPYSTNTQVVAELKRHYPAAQMPELFDDPIQPYSRRQIERVEYFISDLAHHGNSKILVIDDGAYFTRALNHISLRDKELLKRFRERGVYLVEQTTRGHEYLKRESSRELLKYLRISAVTVARAKTKRYLEAPFIGVAVARRMIKSLGKEGRLANLGRVFLLGFGVVGKATLIELNKLHIEGAIDVYDIKWNKLAKDIRSCHANPLKVFPKHGKYNTVLGCTGKAAVHDQDQLDILADDAVLASGSSAAIEFNREKLVDLAYLNERDDFYVMDPEKTRRRGIHATVKMHLNEKEFSFLNAGFPVNFDGGLECLPTLLIQLTHSMLLAAAHQTMKQKKMGLHGLNPKYDEWISERGMRWIERYADGA